MKISYVTRVVAGLLLTLSALPSASLSQFCPTGAPLSTTSDLVALADAKDSNIKLITAWLRPTGVKSAPTLIKVDGSALYVFADTDVRISFRDNGERITRMVLLTSTPTREELDRLTRAVALLISGFSGNVAEPEARHEIAKAIDGRQSGTKLISIKTYGTLALVLSAPNKETVVASIERQRCD